MKEPAVVVKANAHVLWISRDVDYLRNKRKHYNYLLSSNYFHARECFYSGRNPNVIRRVSLRNSPTRYIFTPIQRSSTFILPNDRDTCISRASARRFRQKSARKARQIRVKAYVRRSRGVGPRKEVKVYKCSANRKRTHLWFLLEELAGQEVERQVGLDVARTRQLLHRLHGLAELREPLDERAVHHQRRRPENYTNLHISSKLESWLEKELWWSYSV